MFHKTLLTFTALAALGAAALPLTASPAAAWHRHHHGHRGHFWWGVPFPAPLYFAPAYDDRGCYVRRVVATPYGPRVRWVYVCY